MPQELDYASPDRQATPPAISFAALFAIFALVTFVVTMGVWSRQSPAWTSPGRFEIKATRTAWGLPHWLIFTSVRSTGTAPPISSGVLPQAQDFQPGWHVQPGALCLSLAGCIAAALLFSEAARLFGRGHQSPICGHAIWYAIGGVAVLAGAAGWISDSASDPAKILLTFVALPFIVSVGGLAVRTYPSGVLFAAAATVSFWWALRMVKLRSDTNGMMDSDDLRDSAVTLFIVTIVAVGSVFLSRRRAAARPAA